MTQVPMDELDPAERLATGGERVLLETFLDLYREAITSKVSGLSEEEATRRLVPSATTLIGIVKHLRWVELSWFQRVLAGRPPEDLPPVPWSDDDPDADFRLEPGETVERIIAEYDQECARSRAVAAGRSHDDILREQIDGTTED